MMEGGVVGCPPQSVTQLSASCMLREWNFMARAVRQPATDGWLFLAVECAAQLSVAHPRSLKQ